MNVRRFVTAAVAVFVLAAAGVAWASPGPPSAPSEYVEVLPTAGGGAASGSGSGSPPESSSSAIGAAADAVASGDEWLLGLGAVVIATTVSFAGASALRRRRPHEPKG
jgi:hypothetical protein